MPPGTTTDELIASLATRFERVEQAILGDVTIGHIGLVDRMARIEADHRSVPDVHRDMGKERADGDKRTHEHIEKVEEALGSDVARIEKKIDRLIWIVVGAAAVITGGGSWAFLAG